MSIEASADHRHAMTLSPRVVAREGLRACAATLTYFGPNVARQLGMTPAALRAEIGNEPFISRLMETPLGNVAVVTLPMTFLDMIRDKRLTVEYSQVALDMARAMGAEYISLSGLLASALDYGNRLDAPVGRLTTGHATTAASILKTIDTVLRRVGRTWIAEIVTVLGVGSIGQTVVVAALDSFGPPRRLVLADLPSKRAEIGGLVDEIGAVYPGLDITFANAGQAGQNPLYDATLVIGSTSSPGVLRVESLVPGCIVVDDSVPHCFNVDRAFARATESMDVIFANGGVVRFPEAFSFTSYAPELLHDALDWPAGTYWGPDITSCTLSPLMMTRDPHLPATLGKRAPISAVHAFTASMDAIGVAAPPIRCNGRRPSDAYLEQFEDRFGRQG